MRVGLAPNFTNYAALQHGESGVDGEQASKTAATAARDAWAEEMTLSAMAEPLGFDSLWTYEHHSSPYMMMGNPVQFFAHMAARTTKIDFGTIITVLPWHNPIRLAEDISLLQNQLGAERSFVLGVGRGVARREFHAMGVDLADSARRFKEVLDIVRLALSQDSFSYAGEHFDYTDVSIFPRPLDPSAAHNAYAIVFANEGSKMTLAQEGFHPMAECADSLEDYSASLTNYSDLRAQNGHGPAKPPILQTYLYCCESEQEAREDAQRFHREHQQFGHWHFEVGSDHHDASIQGDDPVVAAVAALLKDPVKMKAMDDKMARIFAEDAIVGTPDQCIERIARANELLMPSDVVVVPRFGSMSAQQARRSVELFAEQALPTVQKMTNANITVTA